MAGDLFSSLPLRSFNNGQVFAELYYRTLRIASGKKCRAKAFYKIIFLFIQNFKYP